MKHWTVIIALLLLLGAGAFWLLHTPPAAPRPEAAQGKASLTLQPVSPRSSVQSIRPPAATSSVVLPMLVPEVQITTAPASNEAAVALVSAVVHPDSQGLSPATMLDNVRRSIRDFGSRFNGNPVGTNPEITKALNGGNPKQVKFLDPASHHVNDKGELLDFWGTPFFFHQLSAFEMEIRSAGPDTIMWTEDDLLTQ